MFLAKKNVAFIALVCILGCLTGCTKSYRAKKLKPLTKELAHFAQTKKNVTLMVKKISQEETAGIFNGCYTQTLYPMQLTLRNEGSGSWIVCANNVKVDMALPKSILADFNVDMTSPWKTGGLAGLGAGVGGFTAVTLLSLYLSNGGNKETAGLVMIGFIIGGVVIVPLFLLAGLVGSLVQLGVNNSFILSLESDVLRKLLVGDVMLEANEEINKLIFVPWCAMPNQFSLTLLSAQSEQDTITFNVNFAR